MRPKLSETDKRNAKLIIRVSREEKLRLRALTKKGKYACMSDLIRTKVINGSTQKIISLNEETNEQLKKLDYEINKIGVNLNQLSKRMNSFSGYRMSDSDRLLLKQAFEMMKDCLVFLQKYLR